MKRVGVIFILILVFAQAVFGQGRPGTLRPQGASPTTTGSSNMQAEQRSSTFSNPFGQSAADSVKFVIADSLISKNNTLDTLVRRYAKDSVIFNVKTKTYHLYKESDVEYLPIRLSADYIQLNYDANEVFAKGLPDTSANNMLSGNPIFQDRNEIYHLDSIRYNYKSRKAKIFGIATEQEGGFIHGKIVKKDEYDNLHLGDAKYTTCDLSEPHFHISANKIMFINKKMALSGPFNIVVQDIPLPIGFFFGFFPVQPKQEIGTSGFIMGTYGEQRNDGRGFYFNDFGYYHAFNEKLSSTTTFQVYTNGSFGARQKFDYAKRYKYNGSFSFQYNRNVLSNSLGLRGVDSTTYDPETGKYQKYNPAQGQFNLIWSHSPRSLRTDRSFSSNINLMSNGFNASNINPANVNAVMQNNVGGNINYMRNLGKLFTSTYSFSVSQNNQTFNSNLGYSMGLKQFNPFIKEKNNTGRWIESFRVGLNLTGAYKVNNQVTTRSSSYTDYNIAGVRNSPYTDEEQKRINELELLQYDLNLTNEERQAVMKELASLRNPTMSLGQALQNGQFTNSYNLPISLPNIKIFRHINITPSISMKGDLYDKSLKYTFVERDSLITLSNGKTVTVKVREQENEEDNEIFYDRNAEGLFVNMTNNSGGVVVVDTLSGLNFANVASFGIGMNTRLYGDFRFSDKGRLRAIRHTINPSINFGFTPANKLSTFEQVRSDGTERYLPRFIGGPASSSRNAGNISFSLSNQLEAKVRSRSDSTDSDVEKIMLLDNLNLRTSYNVFADKFKNEFALSDISLNTSTSFFKRKLSINASAALDPYIYAADPLAKGNGNAAGIRRPVYKWQKKKEGLEEVGNYLTSFNVGVNTSINPDVLRGDRNNARTPGMDPESNTPMDPTHYVDFSIPWNVNMAYNINYNKQGLADRRLTQTLSVSGDLSLTPVTKITFNSGWDFVFNQVTLTTVGIVRELHCWMFTLNWTPISGSAMRSGGFSFTLQPKSALLKDLKVTKRRAGSF